MHKRNLTRVGCEYNWESPCPMKSSYATLHCLRRPESHESNMFKFLTIQMLVQLACASMCARLVSGERHCPVWRVNSFRMSKADKLSLYDVY